MKGWAGCIGGAGDQRRGVVWGGGGDEGLLDEAPIRKVHIVEIGQLCRETQSLGKARWFLSYFKNRFVREYIGLLDSR